MAKASGDDVGATRERSAAAARQDAAAVEGKGRVDVESQGRLTEADTGAAESGLVLRSTSHIASRPQAGACGTVRGKGRRAGGSEAVGCLSMTAGMLRCEDSSGGGAVRREAAHSMVADASTSSAGE